MVVVYKEVLIVGINEIKEYENHYVRVKGFEVIDSFNNSKIFEGELHVKDEFVIFSNKEGFELELHFEEIKEIIL
jgi:hypothetical protein